MILTRQAARFAKGWRARAGPRRGEAGRRRAGGGRPALRARHHRRPPGCGPAARARHHHARRHDPAPGRAARLRRRGRHPLRARRRGRYDGTIAGEFVWGRGKLRAVRAWAADHGVDARRELGLQRLVLRQPAARRRRPPGGRQPRPAAARAGHRCAGGRSPTSTCPPGVPKLPVLERRTPADRADPGASRAAALGPLRHRRRRPHPRRGAGHRGRQPPQLLRPAGARGHVRPPGPARCASWASARCSTPRSSARSPGRWAASGSTAVTGSDEPLVDAAAALASGELVAILPQGTIPRGPAFFEPELKGRWGAARLAALSKVPVIPIGLWGTEAVWPRSERVPRVWNVTSPPTVRVRVGDPVDAQAALAEGRHPPHHGRHRRPAPARGPAAP